MTPFSLVPDGERWPTSYHDEMLDALSKPPVQPIITCNDLWNQINYVFGPGMYQVTVRPPVFEEGLCQVSVLFHPYAESRHRFCSQEFPGYALVAGPDAQQRLDAIEQAKQNALFQILACYGPCFQPDHFLLSQQEAHPAEVSIKGAVPVSISQAPAPASLSTMDQKALAQERTSHFQNLSNVFPDEDEFLIFLALHGLASNSEEWTEWQMSRIQKQIKLWFDPISKDHPVGHANWKEPMLSSQRLELTKITRLFPNTPAAQAFVKKHRDPLGFKSIGEMNAGWGERLLQCIYADPIYVEKAAEAKQEKKAS